MPARSLSPPPSDSMQRLASAETPQEQERIWAEVLAHPSVQQHLQANAPDTGLVPSSKRKPGVFQRGSVQKGTTTIHGAAFHGDLKTLKRLRGSSDLNERDEEGQTALYLACTTGKLAVVRLLLKDSSVLPDAKNSNTHSAALHVAARNGHTAIVKALLQRGCSVDAVNNNSTSPLMLAARYGHEESVRLLLDAGADPQLRDKDGLRTIDIAEGVRSLHLLRNAIHKLQTRRDRYVIDAMRAPEECGGGCVATFAMDSWSGERVAILSFSSAEEYGRALYALRRLQARTYVGGTGLMAAWEDEDAAHDSPVSAATRRNDLFADPHLSRTQQFANEEKERDRLGATGTSMFSGSLLSQPHEHGGLDSPLASHRADNGFVAGEKLGKTQLDFGQRVAVVAAWEERLPAYLERRRGGSARYRLPSKEAENILLRLLHCAQEVQESGLAHGSVSMRSMARFPDGRWRLIDLHLAQIQGESLSHGLRDRKATMAEGGDVGLPPLQRPYAAAEDDAWGCGAVGAALMCTADELPWRGLLNEQAYSAAMGAWLAQGTVPLAYVDCLEGLLRSSPAARFGAGHAMAQLPGGEVADAREINNSLGMGTGQQFTGFTHALELQKAEARAAAVATERDLAAQEQAERKREESFLAEAGHDRFAGLDEHQEQHPEVNDLAIGNVRMAKKFASKLREHAERATARPTSAELRLEAELEAAEEEQARAEAELSAAMDEAEFILDEDIDGDGMVGDGTEQQPKQQGDDGGDGDEVGSEGSFDPDDAILAEALEQCGGDFEAAVELIRVSEEILEMEAFEKFDGDMEKVMAYVEHQQEARFQEQYAAHARARALRQAEAAKVADAKAAARAAAKAALKAAVRLSMAPQAKHDPAATADATAGLFGGALDISRIDGPSPAVELTFEQSEARAERKQKKRALYNQRRNRLALIRGFGDEQTALPEPPIFSAHLRDVLPPPEEDLADEIDKAIADATAGEISMAELDKDGDGEIELGEFVHWMNEPANAEHAAKLHKAGRMATGHEMSAKQLFAHLDKDGSGTISANEIEPKTFDEDGALVTIDEGVDGSRRSRRGSNSSASSASSGSSGSSSSSSSSSSGSSSGGSDWTEIDETAPAHAREGKGTLKEWREWRKYKRSRAGAMRAQQRLMKRRWESTQTERAVEKELTKAANLDESQLAEFGDCITAEEVYDFNGAQPDRKDASKATGISYNAEALRHAKERRLERDAVHAKTKHQRAAISKAMAKLEREREVRRESAATQALSGLVQTLQLSTPHLCAVLPSVDVLPYEPHKCKSGKHWLDSEEWRPLSFNLHLLCEHGGGHFIDPRHAYPLPEPKRDLQKVGAALAYMLCNLSPMLRASLDEPLECNGRGVCWAQGTRLDLLRKTAEHRGVADDLQAELDSARPGEWVPGLSLRFMDAMLGCAFDGIIAGRNTNGASAADVSRSLCELERMLKVASKAGGGSQWLCAEHAQQTEGGVLELRRNPAWTATGLLYSLANPRSSQDRRALSHPFGKPPPAQFGGDAEPAVHKQVLQVRKENPTLVVAEILEELNLDFEEAAEEVGEEAAFQAELDAAAEPGSAEAAEGNDHKIFVLDGQTVVSPIKQASGVLQVVTAKSLRTPGGAAAHGRPPAVRNWKNESVHSAFDDLAELELEENQRENLKELHREARQNAAAGSQACSLQ